MLQRCQLNKACIVYPNYEINYIINVRLSLWCFNKKYEICTPNFLASAPVMGLQLQIIFEGYLICVPHIPQVFISELKKEKKSVKNMKNWKYSKAVVPFGVLVKNMKYVPHFVGHLIYVPHVPQMWDSCGTKSSRALFTLKWSQIHTFCTKINFSRGNQFFIVCYFLDG